MFGFDMTHWGIDNPLVVPHLRQPLQVRSLSLM